MSAQNCSHLTFDNDTKIHTGGKTAFSTNGAGKNECPHAKGWD